MEPEPKTCRGCGVPLVAGPMGHQGRTYKGRLVGACRICEQLERADRRARARQRGERRNTVRLPLNPDEIPLVLEALATAPTGDWEPWQRAGLKLVLERLQTLDMQLPLELG